MNNILAVLAQFMFNWQTTNIKIISTEGTFVTNSIPSDPKEIDTSGSPFMSSLEFILSISVLIFGLIVVFLEIYLVKTKDISADMFVKFIVITLIITGTLFLITAGYNNNQIAPAVGLFGTVAGYLLGKTNSKSQENADV